MCVGEKREAVIPPRLAYDDRSKRFGQRPVPEGATVTYEVAAGGLPPSRRFPLCSPRFLLGG
jgi:hypothetical protein